MSYAGLVHSRAGGESGQFNRRVTLENSIISPELGALPGLRGESKLYCASIYNPNKGRRGGGGLI